MLRTSSDLGAIGHKVQIDALASLPAGTVWLQIRS